MVEMRATGDQDAVDIAETARRIAAGLTDVEIGMLRRGKDDAYLSSQYLAGERHGQFFSHFRRRHPGLFDMRFHPAASTYRRTALGRQVAELVDG